jgi:hypothetical protein
MPHDTRNYVFWLKPSNENVKIDTTKEYNLGRLDLFWRNYYGDLGSNSTTNYKTLVSRS